MTGPIISNARWRAIGRLRVAAPRLTAFGLACLMAAGVALLMPLVDGRRFADAPVWLKPAKFFLSIGVFALTSAWFTHHVRPERRGAAHLRIGTAMLIGAGGFELGYITLQASLGQGSHFNVGNPVHAALYGLMGVGALVLLASKIPLALEIALRPAPGTAPDLRLAIVAGLALTVLLGGAGGILISLNGGAGIGPQGARLPLLGWNLGGGDLRIGHFLGMHAEQVLPLVAALLVALRCPWRMGLVALAAAAWAGFTVFALLQARTGLPIPV